MATDTSKERRNSKKSRAADGFVMMAMAVVTLALCMGLVAQVGLSFWLAVTVSAAFYVGLLTLHALVRRHDQLDELRTEVERLTGEVARLSQMSAPPVRASQATTAPGAPGRAPHIAAQPLNQAPAMPPPPAPLADPLARVAAAMPPVVKVAAETDKAKGAGSSLAHETGAKPAIAHGIDALEDGISGAIPEMRDPVAAQMQKIVRAPQIPGARLPPAEGRAHEPELPMGSNTVYAPAHELRIPAALPPLPPTTGVNRARRNMASECSTASDRKDTTAPPRLEADGSVMNGEPPRSTHAVRSGEGDATQRTTLAPPTSDERSKMAATPATPAISVEPGAVEASIAGTNGSPSLPSLSLEAGGWSYRPGHDTREMGFSPSETDVEMIQGLIKKLADEINSADAQKLSTGLTRDAMDEEALDRSVGALRQAARNMQEPIVPARGSRTTRHVATSTGSASDHMGNDLTRPPELAAPASITRQTASSAPAEPELDVEELMRRAKPIATMTSMPQPLPAAPNIMDQRTTAAQVPEQMAELEDHAPEQFTTSSYAGPDGAGASVAESAIDEIWNTVGDETTTGLAPVHDEVDERVARIADALEAGRVEVFLEPILDLEKQQARHYEVSVLLRDESGAEICPDDPAELERPSGILPLLDSVRLQRTAHVARRLEERNKQGSVFSTFSGQSLTADDFLSTFAETYDAQMQFASQLVLTFTQADARLFRMPHWTMINEMRDLGFGFALRAVTDLDMDFEMFAKSGFTFVKLDADVFLSGLAASDALVPAADLCRHLEGLGLKPIVEAIDDDAKRKQVFAYGVRLGQGRLFGGARQVKTPAGSGTHPAAA